MDVDSVGAETMYDLVVVGAGMIGSAAARHAAEAGLRVGVVAAAEPSDWTSSPGPFASYYDAGRITRVIDEDSLWSELASASAGRYADLEQRTGIGFHDPVGLVWTRPADTAHAALVDARERGADVAEVSTAWVHENYGIVVPDLGSQGCIFEGPPAGLVNPRRFVSAQLSAAQQAGATLIPGPVTGVVGSQPELEVHGDFGEVRSHNILLATGMHGAELAGVSLDLIRQPRTTVRLEIDHRCELPSLIVNDVATPGTGNVYWVPPVRFPNGKVMLKIGGTHVSTQPIEKLDDLAAWFQSPGSIEEGAALRAVVDELIPDATVLSWDTVPCVVTQTPTGYPFVGWVDERIAVAVGGNGSAGKSGDEIGRRAASLFVPGLCQPSEISMFKPKLIT